MRVARPVRRAGRGNGSGETPTPRPGPTPTSSARAAEPRSPPSSNESPESPSTSRSQRGAAPTSWPPSPSECGPGTSSPSPGTSARKCPSTTNSPGNCASTSTSPRPTRHGSVVPMRTATECHDDTCPREPNWTTPPPTPTHLPAHERPTHGSSVIAITERCVRRTHGEYALGTLKRQYNPGAQCNCERVLAFHENPPFTEMVDAA